VIETLSPAKLPKQGKLGRPLELTRTEKLAFDPVKPIV